MSENEWSLASLWQEAACETGQIVLSLSGPQGAFLSAATKLAFTILTRIPPGTELHGARLVRRLANYHEIALPEGALDKKAEPDGSFVWQVTIPCLSHRPNHYTDGPKSAFLVLPDGRTQEVLCLPMKREGTDPVEEVIIPEPEMSGARISPLLGVLPYPDKAQITDWRQTPLHAFRLADKALCSQINALIARLFPEEAPLFEAEGGKTEICFEPAQQTEEDGAKERYHLEFQRDVVRLKADGTGQLYALIALAQMLFASRKDPRKFAFPQKGSIEDKPAQTWRGMHLDVSRQFYSKQVILDFLDRLAWCRINRLHWHLSDDEGWRLESLAYPALTEIGAWRGFGWPLLPQHGSGAALYGGFYSRQDVSEIVAHASSLGIQIIPEIDVPGHCQAVIASLPDLLDSQIEKRQGKSASVQGYLNNAINPGLKQSWSFLERIFSEIAALFPAPYVHIGGDEVADRAWHSSPAARDWARAQNMLDGKGEPDTPKIQAALLRFVQKTLLAAGKMPLGWEEAAKSDGLEPDASILMVWQKADNARALADRGYQLILCPGETYYLDMAQSRRWEEPGLSWAGTSNLKQTMAFDPEAVLPDNCAALVGLQGCIWSENLVTRSLFNHMVFPRAFAIAERGWTKKSELVEASLADRAALLPVMPE